MLPELLAVHEIDTLCDALEINHRLRRTTNTVLDIASEILKRTSFGPWRSTVAGFRQINT